LATVKLNLLLLFYPFDKSEKNNPMDKKTRSITITQFDYVVRNVNDEELDIHGHPNHYTEFDPEGRPLVEISYSRDGTYEDKTEYGYDSDGNLIRESYYPEGHELAEEKTFERNPAGLIARVLQHYQDGSVDTIEFQYNEANQLVQKITTSDEGVIEQVELFKWENDKIVNFRIIDGEGNELGERYEPKFNSNQRHVTYNDKEQPIREEEVNEQGDVLMVINRTYNEDGRADEVEVFIDGRGRTISQHYFLKYEYAFFD
jgi:hypothetical protein